ncbi:hypothetical protein IKE67_08250 [bacterium]|nr:hypothetical protein [bacterium]
MFKVCLHNCLSVFKKYKIDICIVLIFLLTLSLRVCAIHNKTFLFFDDVSTFIVSTPNNLLEDGSKVKYGWADLRFKYGQDYTAYDIKKALMESKADLKSICKDLISLHNVSLDNQHTNFYLSIFRIWSSGADFSSTKSMILVAGYLNLIFFTMAFLFMYKLLYLIKPDKVFIAIGLFFAFITTGSISNTLLLRSYPLMEALFILAMYYFVVLYKSTNTKNNITIKEGLLYSFIFALFLLSDYYPLVLMVFLTLILTVRTLKEKKIKICISVWGIMLFAILLVYLFCPSYFENFKNIEHMKETRQFATFTNFIDIYRNGLYMIEFLVKYIFNNLSFYIIVLAMGIMGIPVLGKNKLEKDEWKKFLLIYGITFLWAYVVVVISPFHEDPAVRYIIPTFSVLGLILGVINYHLRKEYVIILMLVTTIASYAPVSGNIILKRLNFKNYGVVSFAKDFDYLNINHFVYNKKTKQIRKVVFVNRNWMWPTKLFYLPNDTIVRFERIVPSDYYLNEEYVLVNNEKIKVVYPKIYKKGEL